jgi:hypothetical protein
MSARIVGSWEVEFVRAHMISAEARFLYEAAFQNACNGV